MQDDETTPDRVVRRIDLEFNENAAVQERFVQFLAQY